jgi:hypothetical protein
MRAGLIFVLAVRQAKEQGFDPACQCTGVSWWILLKVLVIDDLSFLPSFLPSPIER